MKELLIIRSVSLQQLDKNLPVIKELFPDHRINLLAHEHGVKLVEKYRDIDRVYVYPFKGSFSAKQPVNELKSKEFDAIIVPVGNLTGAGFHNVLEFSLTLNGKKRWMCNLVSELRELSPLQIQTRRWKNSLYAGLSTLLTSVISLFLLPVLPWLLKRLEKK
ncbi:glycosyltransferase family 9 protein [Ammoniphilus sp. CFH 90114]|uniref:glycosyltransferase family 9 protein n=1 Tax=Ammoniphilus sp. CFH 90114 TaxID=2493665 RepID=UPI00100F76F9|nr:hypothetical protein [Ammoniphilus sp. CFH 90114]RXT04465.1 hypothetical protein EIZ39_19775 [Ammoniphilus sp. CFH 90114]